MHVEDINKLFLKHKENQLSHRYVTNKHIEPLLEKCSDFCQVETIGESVLQNPIYGVKIGNGKKRIFMWTQMHGNESTTTKALFDLFNTFFDANSELNHVLETCTTL